MCAAWNPKTTVYVPRVSGLWECGSMECGGTELSKGSTLRTFYLEQDVELFPCRQQTNSQSTSVSLKST